VVYPIITIIYRVSTIQGGAGFRNHPRYNDMQRKSCPFEKKCISFQGFPVQNVSVLVKKYLAMGQNHGTLGAQSRRIAGWLFPQSY